MFFVWKYAADKAIMGEVGKKGKAQRMNVTMYEVNFGEAILYEENEQKFHSM